MDTINLNSTARWTDKPLTTQHTTIWNKVIAMADSQAKYRTFWFIISLIVQGVLFLPVPAVLLYYYQAPLACLGVTLSLFFANMILGMGGASVRVLLFVFILSIVAHSAMLTFFML
jgi:hypothetical protein